MRNDNIKLRNKKPMAEESFTQETAKTVNVEENLNKINKSRHKGYALTNMT